MLDVDGGIDVDAGFQDLLHVEVALGMAAAGCVGVGEFVDKGDLRPAGQDGIEVHLVQPAPFVLDAPARDDLEAVEQRLGLLPAMGFDHPDDDVVAVLDAGAGGLQHFVGLADAGGRADKDAKLADAAILSPGCFQQGVGRWSPVSIVSIFRHCASALSGYSPKSTALGVEPNAAHTAWPLWAAVASRSTARLSSSTLTRGSPSMPRRRPSV